MDRLINKNAVIDIVKNNYRMKALELIEELPSADKWTPVSERLPDDSDEYLVTVTDVEDRNYMAVGVAWFAQPKDYYDVGDGEWRELQFNEKVTAWQPKPKPYSEGSNKE